MRLRRSDPAQPGYGRRRRGRGFSYVGIDGTPLTGADELQRCRDLVIPPAWRDVWICPDPAGHLQATGVDVAGRRQYLYHPQWRLRRDRRKFAHVLDVANRLPRLRRRVARDLGDPALSRTRTLALAARLLDRGLFRVGGDEYANGEEPTYGVATLVADHVSVGSSVRFCYRAKGGIERTLILYDRQACEAIRALKRHRHGEDRLLAFRGDDGSWHDVRSADVNAYLRDASGIEMSAKDLRTWHATVGAAIALARADRARSATAAKRVVARVMREVAEDLGNTPTVARASYVDPKVVDLYLRGETVQLPDTCPARGPSAERAVLDLLDSSGPDTRDPGRRIVS